MLVLSRKLGETITIGATIKVEVIGVSGNRVRLGITAPEDCRIVRGKRQAEEPVGSKPTLATSLADTGI